jgi:hypothetical protein
MCLAPHVLFTVLAMVYVPFETCLILLWLTFLSKCALFIIGLGMFLLHTYQNPIMPFK